MKVPTQRNKYAEAFAMQVFQKQKKNFAANHQMYQEIKIIRNEKLNES